MLKFFAEKMSVASTHIFSPKNIRILYIESAKTVNEMTVNELVKLTMLWTTGPWTDTPFIQSYDRRIRGRHLSITKTCLFKYTENFTTKKWKFSDKNSDAFHISDQNIDCGFSLELPWPGGSNEYPQSMFLSRNKKIMYTPVNPCFTI